MSDRAYLPVVPQTVLRRHKVHERFDHRFRACARLLQSLWRAERGLPIGAYVRSTGQPYRLGSMIAAKAGEAGLNFLTPDIARLARREVAYREPCALMDEKRLLTNLLSSMPLTFNLLGPLRLDLKLATKVLRRLCPDLRDVTVQAILFEHSPGRADPSLTGDHTAFDAMMIYGRPDGARGFVAVEVKYSESMTEPQRELKPRYQEITPVAGLHQDPMSPALRTGTLQQFFRQHMLAQAALLRGDYSEGRFVVIAPRFNTPVQSAIAGYRGHLNPPTQKQVGFGAWGLEEVIDQLGLCGEKSYADALRRRYCDWLAVDRVIEEAIAQMSSFGAASNDNRDADVQVA